VHGALALERVPLEHAPLALQTLGLEHALHFVGAHETRQVAVGHLGQREAEVLLGARLGLVGAVDVVEASEGALGPDAEAAQVAARSDLQQVEFVDVEQGHACAISKEHIYNFC